MMSVLHAVEERHVRGMSLRLLPATAAGRPRSDALIVFFLPGGRPLLAAMTMPPTPGHPEHSASPRKPPIYQFKTVIRRRAFLLVQAFVEMIRCVLCLKQAVPSRQAD